ncbi:hypothetical protein FACS1894219_10030 [Clostridia bacterium]|nr:hypothetical protein FACS1894219_10030 [Clostridia bacterium]
MNIVRCYIRHFRVSVVADIIDNKRRSGRNFGDGDIDWAKYFINHNKFTPDAPFILEYCNESNFRETAAKVRAYKEF